MNELRCCINQNKSRRTLCTVIDLFQFRALHSISFPYLMKNMRFIAKT